MNDARAALPDAFRIAALANLVRQFGFWIGVTVFQWHVAERSGGDAGASSTLYFLQLLPMFLLPPVLGALADRWSRWWLVVLPGCFMTFVALSVSVVSDRAPDGLEVWQVQLVALALGISTALSSPSFQALIPAIVPPEGLPRAVSIVAALINVSRLAGPGIAGVALALGGDLTLCLRMLAGFEAMCILLMLAVPRDTPNGRSGRGYFSEMVDGFRETTRQPSLGRALLLAGATSLFGLAYLSVLPSVTVRVLESSDSVYAVLLAAAALGGLTAAFLRALQPRTTAAMSRGLIGMAVTVLTVMASPWIPLTAVACYVLSAFGAGIMIGLNIFIQQKVSDEYRGRVVSLFLWAWGGILPFGGLLFGVLVERTSFTATGIAMGTLLVLVAVVNQRRSSQ